MTVGWSVVIRNGTGNGGTGNTRRGGVLELGAGLLLAGLLLAGCAVDRAVLVPTHDDPHTAQAASPYGDPDTLQSGEIMHVPTGRMVSPEALINVLADARVVYVGEMHTSLEDHAVQLRVLEGLAQNRPGKIVLGLEMFETSAQAELDRWVAGDLPERAFQRVWYRNWSSDFNYYRDILVYARDHRIPVIALNATRTQVREASSGSAYGEDHWAEADWDGADPYHRAYLNAIIGGHAHGGADGFYKVQMLWDETMAERVARTLRDPKFADHQMLVLAGGGHVQYGFGIPRRVFRRVPASYVTVLPWLRELPEDRDDLRMDVEVPDFPLPVADFVWAVDYRDLDGSRILLGVQLDRRTDGVWVASVVDGSAAATAGVLAGDQITAVDGEKITEYLDLRLALGAVTAGTTGVLTVARAGEPVDLSITYQTAAQAEQAAP